MLGFLFILSHDLRWHHRRRKRDSPGSVSLPRGRPMGVAAKLVPVQWSPRKATKCLLCCWSTAHFFSYVNAVICRWLWWIPTRRKTFQLSPPCADLCAHPSRVTVPPKVTHLTCCDARVRFMERRQQWVVITRTVVTPRMLCLFAQAAEPRWWLDIYCRAWCQRVVISSSIHYILTTNSSLLKHLSCHGFYYHPESENFQWRHWESLHIITTYRV